MPLAAPITPRNKIEELQQRKEADLKAQLARTQKLQQELEAANQVRGWVLRSAGIGTRVGGLGYSEIYRDYLGSLRFLVLEI